MEQRRNGLLRCMDNVSRRCNQQNKLGNKMFQNTAKSKKLKATGLVVGFALVGVLTIFISTNVGNRQSGPAFKPHSDNIAKDIKARIVPENMRKTLKKLTKKAHPAGTANNLNVANMIKQQMMDQGVEDVFFNEYDVLLSYPNWTQPNRVQILAEDGSIVWQTTGRSVPMIHEEQTDLEAEIQWLAYSASGTVEGDVVYVNKASVDDFKHLEAKNIDVKGKILLARFSNAYRGNIAKIAVQKGAIGLLIFSDPVQVASLGVNEENVFKNTDKMPSTAVQRGSVYVGMGDPQTPTYPALSGLYKSKTVEDLFREKTIPTIPILPIPYGNVSDLLEIMKGDAVIPDFQGALNVTYRYGPGLISNQKLRMIVHARNEETKIQNVVGFLKGDVEPDKFVILSNHYDAWTYGAIDPNSGTAVLLEVSRVLMEHHNQTGWRPDRTILFAHFDAEEYGLIGSTEFAEEYRVQLMNKAIAVVNMDNIGGNQTILVMSNPTTYNVIKHAAKVTPHPNPTETKDGRLTIFDSWKFYAQSKSNRTTDPFYLKPAGGSDHGPFFDYLGIPIITFLGSSLDAPPTYPLYHTIHETPYLVEKILDPEFKMHKAITEMFIEMVLKFTESPIIPYELEKLMDEAEYEYIPSIKQKLGDVSRNFSNEVYVKDCFKQIELLLVSVKKVSEIVAKRNTTVLSTLSLAERIVENNRLIEFEKCFIIPQGIGGNLHARHVLFHPSPHNWYSGAAIAQVHDLINSLAVATEANRKTIAIELSKEIAAVTVAFNCARITLNANSIL